jgi:3-phenylpropionate/trans-cinnamate dioxygenase ferredoxin component
MSIRNVGEKKLTEFVEACSIDEIDEEDVIRFDWNSKTYAIYRTGGAYYATDGYCTHAHALLSDGLVMGGIIECPFHQGRFDIRTGQPKGAPVCVALKTYLVEVRDGHVYIKP